MTPRVTVVVPTVDRVDLLRRCLRSLPGSDAAEVVVVHDGDPGVQQCAAAADHELASARIQNWQLSLSVRVDLQGIVREHEAPRLGVVH